MGSKDKMTETMIETLAPPQQTDLPMPSSVHLEDVPPGVVRGPNERISLPHDYHPNVLVYDFETGPSYVLTTGDIAHGNSTITVVDSDREGNMRGFMAAGRHLGLQAEAPEFATPHVQITQTEKGSERQGLGLRRLRIMNDMSARHYGMSLRSDLEHTEPEVQRLWERLVRSRDAERFFDENDTQRWRFRQRSPVLRAGASLLRTVFRPNKAA